MTQPDQSPSGPYGAYRWKHNGRLVEGRMQPQTWELARRLYEKFDRFVDMHDLIMNEQMFDESYSSSESPLSQYSHIKKQGSNITKWFSQRAIPLCVKTRDKFIWMQAKSNSG